MIAENFVAPWLRLDFPFPCEIHYSRPSRLQANGNFKVLMMNSEPGPLSTKPEELQSIHSFFDLIIVYNKDYLIYPNAVFAPYGGTFVTAHPPRKEFSASFIHSLGAAHVVMMPGYQERMAFVDNTQYVTETPLQLFRGRYAPPGPAEQYKPLVNGIKDCLFESMFHISIENYRSENFFTEKICDCFATHTVPIYYGCPNIGDYFDMDGIIIADNHQHMIEILNDLSVDDYYRRLPAVHNNFLASQRYWETYPLRIRELILAAWARKHETGKAV